MFRGHKGPQGSLCGNQCFFQMLIILQPTSKIQRYLIYNYIKRKENPQMMEKMQIFYFVLFLIFGSDLNKMLNDLLDLIVSALI